MTNGTDSFAELFRKYGDEVFRTCMLFLRNRESAEDAVMEAYLRALRAYGRFRGGSSEKTWLIRIAVNVCKDMLKSPAYRMNTGSEPLELMTVNDGVSDSERKAAVSSAVAALPPEFREAAILHLYNGFTIKESARIAGITQTAMAYRVKRAKELLREALSDWYFS